MSELQLSLHPIARIHGEPLLELPQGLYISPDALELVLENFQGPLDLLLYLIRKHNLDVLDIPMAELTRQYMSYIEMMQQHRLELAADYLLMAAVLIEIKSRMLLPRAKLNTHHKVRRDQLSVREQMAHILRCLRGGEYVAFDRLFDVESGVAKLVVTFIAILELAKEYLVEIQQSETFGSIYVRTNRAIA